MNSSQLDSPPASCPFHTESPAAASFFIVDALGGFVCLERRPETLNGSMLSRATACKPFMEGNKLGTHLRLSQAVMLSRDPEVAALQMTDEHYQIAHSGYDERIAHLVSSGLIEENGFWHNRLKLGPVDRKDGVVSLWTGLLVRPAPGLWLLSTGSYNRRSEVNLKDFVIASSEGYTPLILEFDLASMWKDTMWLELELACLVPLQPNVFFERKTLAQAPELGQAHNEFYGGKYLESRGDNKPVGRYRKLVSNASANLSEGTAVCELVHIAGPDVHTIEHFPTVWGPQGALPAETAASLSYVMLRNFTPLEFDFDGLQSHLNNADADLHGAELLAIWQDFYGSENVPHVDWWSDYFIGNVPMHFGEPNILIIPYSFIRTPPGWSALADGSHYPGLDGLRGLIATDLFFHAGPVFNYRRQGDFRLEVGDPILRVLPIPRRLLDSPFTVEALPA